MRASPIIPLVVISVFLNISSVYGCSCRQPGTPTQELESSSAVFAGKVIGIEEPAIITSSADKVKITFDVLKVWKGPASERIVLSTETSSSSCGFRFQENEEYLIYAYGDENGISASLCSRTTRLSEAFDDIEELDKGQPNGDISSLIIKEFLLVAITISIIFIVSAILIMKKVNWYPTRADLNRFSQKYVSIWV